MLVAAASMPGADDPLSPFSVVAIRPATTSLFIATVTMSFEPFVRHRTEFSSAYSARVFPYFFWSEKGRIWIVVPDEVLRRAARGEPIDFAGHALSESGDERKVSGRAFPTGPTGGKITVRVYVSRRIALTYDTTYELKGPAALSAAITPRPAR
jgi:hypothetical protein